jgi:integrase
VSDVVVKEDVKVNHADGCTERRSCGCPRIPLGYRYEICFEWPSGNLFRERKRVPIPGISRAKAESWANQRLRNILAQGEHKLAEEKEEARATGVPTVKEFGPRYVNEYLKANRKKPRTVAEYENILDYYLYPRFGHRRLDSLTKPDIQKLKGDLEDLSPKTVNNVLTVLATLLGYAADDEVQVIPEIPVTIKHLKTAPAEVEYYEPAVYETVVAAARKLDIRSYAMVLLGGDAGLRRGEMVALEWSDLDLARGRLTVNRSESKGMVALPKGGRRRSIRMTGRLRTALQEMKRLRGKRVLWRDPEYRWDKPYLESGVTDRTLQSWMERVQRRAGVEVTGNLHILRHTFCSRLAMLGVPAKAIQGRRGTSGSRRRSGTCTSRPA